MSISAPYRVAKTKCGTCVVTMLVQLTIARHMRMILVRKLRSVK